MESKKCSICGVEKTSDNTVGRYLKCKDCISKYKKQYRESNKEKKTKFLKKNQNRVE